MLILLAVIVFADVVGKIGHGIKSAGHKAVSAIERLLHVKPKPKQPDPLSPAPSTVPPRGLSSMPAVNT